MRHIVIALPHVTVSSLSPIIAKLGDPEIGTGTF